ncbi:MAG: chorismate synthase [Phycisphaerae bacterium]
MATLTYRTAGESHGPALISLIEGLPAGLPLDLELINNELKRRQGGYGRGGRQKLETDTVQFLTGFRRGKATGAPLTALVANRDSRLDDTPALYKPRPGHADLAGAIKYLMSDCREILERASARETANRVAVGAVAKCLLRLFGIEVVGFVTAIGTVAAEIPPDLPPAQLLALRDASDTYCPDRTTTEAQIDLIRQMKSEGDTVGGIVESRVFGCPIGLGSMVHWDWKLDSRIAAEVMGVQAIKGVEIGRGFESAQIVGSELHDPIRYDASKTQEANLGYVRDTNNAGGLEGGMTNGQTIVVRAAMKPIATLLKKPMPSVHLETKAADKADYERSDVCAVSACSVIIEAVVAFEIARALREKFGGDSLREMQANFNNFMQSARHLSKDDLSK